MEGRAMTAML